jgi:hypothetical protein
MATKRTVTRKPIAAKAGPKAAAAKKAKAASEADSKAKHTALERDLKPVAKEINARLDRAEANEKKADDLRLSAATMLANTKAKCDSAGMKFKAWCEANISKSYNTARQLAFIGAQPEPALALADFRASQAKKMKASRAKASASNNSAGRTVAKGNSNASAPSTQLQLLDAVTGLGEEKAVKLAREVAAQSGMAIISQGQAQALREANGNPSIANIKAGINKLSPVDRRGMLRWLTERVEDDAAQAGIVAASASQGNPLDIPASLRRNAPKGAGKARKVSRGAVAN